MRNGIVNVYKEKGYTSFDVVAKLRGIFKQKKIGHTGTLDPNAEGVLPVCLGKATKVCDILTDKTKEYETVMRLGVTTDTQDMTGTVLRRCEVSCSGEEAAHAASGFLGESMQVPPMYSALKVNGKKLCDLARAGQTVERKARPITVYELEIQEIKLPLVSMRIACSKGTYIRTICHDIGEWLGCGACMESLVRTRVSDFSIRDALTIAEIERLVQSGDFSFVHPVDSVFMQYPKAVVREEFSKLLYNGNSLSATMLLTNGTPDNGGTLRICDEPDNGGTLRMDDEPDNGGIFRIYDEKGMFAGIYSYSPEQGNYKPVKLFME